MPIYSLILPPGLAADGATEGHGLFTSGYDSYAIAESGIPFYMYGVSGSRESMNLFVGGSQESSVYNRGLNTFIQGLTSGVSDIWASNFLFVEGGYTYYEMNLFLQASGVVYDTSAEMNLFLEGLTNLVSDEIPLFLYTVLEDSGQVPLFVNGYGITAGYILQSGCMNLFINSPSGEELSLDMYVYGSGPTTASMNLYQIGASGTSGDIELYVYGLDDMTGNLSLFTRGYVD
jgi:hypothetical protein